MIGAFEPVIGTAKRTDSAPPSLVEVEDDLRCCGMRLAGKHEARVDLALFQCKVLVHLDAPADELCPTCPAHAALARVRRVGSNAQRRVENAFSVRLNGESRASP